MAAVAKTVAQSLEEAITRQGHASLAVPGGTTPAPFFEILCQAVIDWSKVRIVLTDERFVPIASPRSNTGLLEKFLLRGPAAAAQLVPMYRPGARPEDVLQSLQTGVDAILPLDVCVLGMGEDMHIASLFPGADRLAEALEDGAPSVLALRAANASEPRLTLTAPVLTGARHIHVLIVGPGKKAALERAMQQGSVLEAPVRCLLDRGVNTVIHYAD